MRATFEEKTYENYFNIELARQADILFPLGQVQEGSLGFDTSAMIQNRRLGRSLRSLFMLYLPSHGVDLIEIAGEMERFLQKELDNIPPIKANLLIQYKKPQYITMSNGNEWAHWKVPYYRYDIYSRQQKLLMHIHNLFGSKVFIVYASPALHDIKELVDAHINGQIIDISNFRKAYELDGHHRNTYTKEGQYSVAYSAPEKIDNFNLVLEINEKKYDSNEDTDNRSFVINFCNKISKIIHDDKYYNESYVKLNENLLKFKKYELLYSYFSLRNFSQLTGTQWIMKL